MSAFNKKESGIWTSLDLKKTRIKLAYWIVFAVMALLTAICLFPILWIFLSAFKDMKEFTSVPPTIIPKTFHPEKIVEVWKSMNFGKFYLNTLTVALGSLIVCILSNGLAGYVLSRLKPKGYSFFFRLIVWTMLMPTSVSMIPLYMTFIDFPIFHFNLTDTYIPMWMMAGAAPFYIMVFKSFFDSIPLSYIEAARIDGCSTMGIFMKIIIPLSKPVLVVIAMFTLNGAWGDFFWPYLVLKNPNLMTVSVQIFNMKNGSWSTNVYMIALMFVILPPALFFVFAQKHIMTGFTMSGVKG